MIVRAALLGATVLSAGCANTISKEPLPDVDDEAPSRKSITLPFTAGGNEPGWHVEVDADGVKLMTDYGQSSWKMKLLDRDTEGGTTRFRAASATDEALVSATATICRDSATGMPHPFSVTVKIRGNTRTGCGGQPSSLLVAREWVVEDLGGRGIVEGSRMTLEFNADGHVAGNASCNRYTAEYRLTGEALTINSAATTRMMCPEALMTQERRFLDILKSIRHFDLDRSGALVLEGNAGSLVAR